MKTNEWTNEQKLKKTEREKQISKLRNQFARCFVQE